MTPEQSRMARAMLNWSLSDLAEAASVGRATAARFELGQPIQDEKITALRAAFEAERVKFIDSGKLAGAVYRMRSASSAG